MFHKFNFLPWNTLVFLFKIYTNFIYFVYKIHSEEWVSKVIVFITWISHFFSRNNPSFFILKFVFIKTEYSPIDFYVIFSIKSPEFLKSINFGSNLKKKILLFRWKKRINFYKYIFSIWTMIYSYRSEYIYIYVHTVTHIAK